MCVGALELSSPPPNNFSVIYSAADQTVFTPRLGRELALLMGVEAIISPQLLLDDDVFVNLPTYFKRVHFV